MRKTPTLLDYLVVGMITIACLSFAFYIGLKIVAYTLKFIVPGMSFVLFVGCATPQSGSEFKYAPGVLDRAKAYIDESEEYIEQLPERLPASAFNLREWATLFISSCRTDLSLFAENPTKETEANLIISLHNLILSRQLLEEVMAEKKKISI